MDIYLLRHAEAEPRGAGCSDEERELTDKGRQQADRAAAWLRVQELEVDIILSSPAIRAVQTAQPVAEALGKAVVTDWRLAGMRLSVNDVRDLAQEYNIAGSMLLVGHEPDMGDLIQELTKGQVEVKKAALALVSCERLAPGGGVLRWLVPSKLQGS